MRIIGRNVPMGIACSVFFLSVLFTALPNWLFIDFPTKVVWYWGCPSPCYAVQHSIYADDHSYDFHGFLWNRLFIDLIFWVIYFSLFAFCLRVSLRLVKLKVRPFLSLSIVGILTAILYVHFFRPYALVDAVTGGYLSFLETKDRQIDLSMRFGDTEKLQTLFMNHPNLVFSHDITGQTPLHLAAYYGQSEIVRVLLDDKADVQAKDMCGETPLFCSAMNGYTGATELLLKNGAKANVRDDTGETPLIKAAEGGHNSVVKLLLNNKADVNARDSDGSTALYEAAIHGYRETAQLLIASNAEIDVKDNQGETPLFVAAQGGYANVVGLLLLNNADINIKDKNGMTPLQIASNENYTNVVNLLRQYGHK